MGKGARKVARRFFAFGCLNIHFPSPKSWTSPAIVKSLYRLKRFILKGTDHDHSLDHTNESYHPANTKRYPLHHIAEVVVIKALPGSRIIVLQARPFCRRDDALNHSLLAAGEISSYKDKDPD